MFLVSTGIIFWSGCFRPPCGGTLITDPSNNFNKPCCTPSPLTSRVIEGLSLFRAILSISSIKTIPLSAVGTSYSATCNNLVRMLSISSPTYPASVKTVASTIVRGTCSILAIVRAKSVLPVPVEPTIIMLDFSISTSSSVSTCSKRL